MTTTTSRDVTSSRSLPPSGAPSRRRRSLAQWCIEHRWRTLFAGLLVLAGAVVLLGGGLTTTAPADQLVGDSRDAVKISEGADFGDHPTETVVVTRPTGAFPPQRSPRWAASFAVPISDSRGWRPSGRRHRPATDEP